MNQLLFQISKIFRNVLCFELCLIFTNTNDCHDLYHCLFVKRMDLQYYKNRSKCYQKTKFDVDWYDQMIVNQYDFRIVKVATIVYIK